MPVPTAARPGDADATAARAATTATQPEPAKRPSRAGRNLPAAIGVGVGLGGLVLASLFLRKELFALVVILAVGYASWELTSAFRQRTIRVPIVPVLVGGVGMQVSAYLGGPQSLFVAFALTGTAVLLWRLIDHTEGAVRDVAAGVFVAGYLPYLAGFAILMLAEPDGPWRIVAMIGVPVASDVGGYVFGVLWGRHPMAPSVSPKKSWEGMAGSMTFGVVAAVAAVVFGLGGPWWGGVIVGGCAVITATVGDLSESLLKRDLGIKDMGTLLPGHGGLLDRIDSLLPTAPILYLLLALLVPTS